MMIHKHQWRVQEWDVYGGRLVERCRLCLAEIELLITKSAGADLEAIYKMDVYYNPRVNARPVRLLKTYSEPRLTLRLDEIRFVLIQFGSFEGKFRRAGHNDYYPS